MNPLDWAGDMRHYIASYGMDDGSSWGLLPPVLPTGDPIAAASLLDNGQYMDVKVVLPVGRPGRRTDLTFFYWQTYAANQHGRIALETCCRNELQFSPAVSSEGDDLWIVRAPQVDRCLDVSRSNIVWHPRYPDRHPLAHMSGRIRTMSNMYLVADTAADYDMFYIMEHPLYLLVSERLLEALQQMHITGIGYIEYPTIHYIE